MICLDVNIRVMFIDTKPGTSMPTKTNQCIAHGHFYILSVVLIQVAGVLSASSTEKLVVFIYQLAAYDLLNIIIRQRH